MGRVLGVYPINGICLIQSADFIRHCIYTQAYTINYSIAIYETIHLTPLTPSA
jgi:hypothetical protein